MDRIKLLPEIVANQIAAGEVVNAPSNVVKEMMENSIDAGAKCVRVNFRNGGKDMIQIVDDGIGMSMMDARMAFDRHATSKIRSIEDVYQLYTFGFRGEALASIAAVAEVELRTRREEDELGTLTEISGGEFRNQTLVSCSKGSQFVVRNLFYNVPSRRKFIDVQVIFHKMEQRTLVAAMKFYCGKELEAAHSADADTLATYEVLCSQLDRYADLENNVDFLSEFSSRGKTADFAGRIGFDENGTEIITFGKHKGKSVEEVFRKEPSYYDWMMNGDFPLYTKQVITRIKTRMK